jgi:hypothetical protein
MAKGLSQAVVTMANLFVTFGFRVVIGGSSQHRRPVARNEESKAPLTLSSRSALNLVQHEYFLEMKKSAIDDKSKADGFAKLVVCGQVLWVFLACMARKVAGYPITILEIYALVHIVCAFMMHLLWWKVSLHIGRACR